MIHTSRQLKDLIKNKSKGDSAKAQILLRNYMMERFLERMSVSKYKKNFILKGGMLVSSMVGIDFRSTMDIDTTLKNIPLSVESATEIIEDIISVHLDDEVSFKIKTVSEIMEESEYGGICEKSSKMYNFSPENVQVILRQKVYKSLGDGFPV
jgi:hypothetical protein